MRTCRRGPGGRATPPPTRRTTPAPTCVWERVRVAHLGRSTCHAISDRRDRSTRIPERASAVNAAPDSTHHTRTDLYSSEQFSIHELRRNVKRFRGGFAFQAHTLLYHSTLGSRVIKKKKNPHRPAAPDSTHHTRTDLLDVFVPFPGTSISQKVLTMSLCKVNSHTNPSTCPLLLPL